LGRPGGDTISAKDKVAMNRIVTIGFVLSLAALVVALDISLALKTIDRLAQLESYTDIQNALTVAGAPPIRF